MYEVDHVATHGLAHAIIRGSWDSPSFLLVGRLFESRACDNPQVPGRSPSQFKLGGCQVGATVLPSGPRSKGTNQVRVHRTASHPAPPPALSWVATGRQVRRVGGVKLESCMLKTWEALQEPRISGSQVFFVHAPIKMLVPTVSVWPVCASRGRHLQRPFLRCQLTLKLAAKRCLASLMPFNFTYPRYQGAGRVAGGDAKK